MVKILRKVSGILVVLLILKTSILFGTEPALKPVTPNASAEAKALLQFLYIISGKYTLTGQHNFPNIKDRNSRFASNYIGETPVVFSTDWGFARDGDTDSYLARPAVVEEIKRQHRLGSIITICWHAVPPTADEPVTFQPRPGGAPAESLASVQGRLLDQQFIDILTPGRRLHERWCAQVDSIAVYLKDLQDTHVPILWRPYHEMNGDWFWWGGRRGEYSSAALYRQIFERLVKHHKLDNLIWVWSVDRPNTPEMNFRNYFPGTEYLDVLSLDVYRRDFNQSYYDSLLILAKGKPLALAEVGNPPAQEVLANQPKWTLYVTWAGMVRNTFKKQYRLLVDNPRILSLEDPAYREAITPFRAVCGLPPLPAIEVKKFLSRPDFSGEWIFDEDKSLLDNMGVSSLPSHLRIIQEEDTLNVRRTFIVEYADDSITEEKVIVDGKEYSSEFRNAPRMVTSNWSGNKDTLIVVSKVQFHRGSQNSEMVIHEAWTLQPTGTALVIRQFSTSFWGERKITLVFNRK